MNAIPFYITFIHLQVSQKRGGVINENKKKRKNINKNQHSDHAPAASTVDFRGKMDRYTCAAEGLKWGLGSGRSLKMVGFRSDPSLNFTEHLPH